MRRQGKTWPRGPAMMMLCYLARSGAEGSILSAGSKTDARACGDRLGNNAHLRSHALRPCRATPRRAGRVVDPDVSDGRAGEDWANCRVPQAVPKKKAANPAVLCTHP